MNSKISLTYNNTTDLKAFGIDLNRDRKFSMIVIPRSHIKSTDGKLGERYWNFNTDKSFTFTTEPFNAIPEEYIACKKSLLSMWKTIKH